ncbi:MAG: dTDP-4-dehydrorhamnose 3,5-epimerase [Pseudoflavonifractor sp.]|nr:dTDP-4-dehydrorhamnose 3,5-epimerase [Alloprevotella sp.]MCM1116717.1 dTDP-4-dehydrorhamnose 3,5-epimerase [Pseudoflavonifractor sp.]
MNVIDTSIPGVKIIEPAVHHDRRGYFFESYSREFFDRLVAPGVTFVQDNESRSSLGVVRGLHFQLPPFAQSKLVRVVEGKVVDIAVDLRVGSPTFGKQISVELSADNHRQVFLPKGMAHGFSVVSPTATFLYKVDEFYHPEAEGAISILDPSFVLPLPLDEAILSDKDLHHPLLADFISPFRYNE